MTVKIILEGAKASQQKAVTQILTAENVMDYNTLEYPRKVYPVEKEMDVSGSKFEITLEKNSFTVLKTKYK